MKRGKDTIQHVTAITLDDKTKNLLDDYATKHSISRSSAIRVIVNEYFLKVKQ